MMYFVMAALGAAVGWYIKQYMNAPMSMPLCVVIGIAGGLVGGAIATLFSFAAVIMFQLILAGVGAFFLVYFVQRFLKKG